MRREYCELRTFSTASFCVNIFLVLNIKIEGAMLYNAVLWCVGSSEYACWRHLLLVRGLFGWYSFVLED